MQKKPLTDPASQAIPDHNPIGTANLPPGPNSVNPYPDPEDAVGSAGEDAAEEDTEETEQESDQSILDYIERKKLQNKILQEIIDKLKATK